MQHRRVVATGLGMVCPVGNDVATSWEAMLAGRSGIGLITRFDTSGLQCRIAGEVKGFEVAAYMPPKEARRLDTFIHYGVARIPVSKSPTRIASVSAASSARASVACR